MKFIGGFPSSPEGHLMLLLFSNKSYPFRIPCYLSIAFF